MSKIKFLLFLVVMLSLCGSVEVLAQAKKSAKPIPVKKAFVKEEPKKEVIQNGMVSLTFDDNHFSQIFALPYMSFRSLKGTLYVTTGPIHEKYRDYHFGVEYLKLFKSAGWQIASHGYQHENFPDFFNNELKLWEDLGYAHEHLNLGGFMNISSFAPPYSKLSKELYEVVKNYTSYKSLRHVYDPSFCEAKGCKQGLNEIVGSNALSRPFKKQNLYDLCSIDIGPSPKPFYSHDLFDLILEAKKDNKWLVITFHKFAVRDAKAEDYEMLESEFKELLDFLVKNNMKVVTVDEGIKLTESAKILK